jgi:hypothetical protein
MPSTIAAPTHTANKVAPRTPRRSSARVPRAASNPSAVSRPMAAAAAATAPQRNQFVGSPEYRSSASRGRSACLRGAGVRRPVRPRRPSQHAPACPAAGVIIWGNPCWRMSRYWCRGRTSQRSTTLVGPPGASSDVSPPTQMANRAFAVRLLFPPACAIGTQPPPTRCEYLACWRVGQADRTPTLRASNLHGIPCAPQS